MRSNFKEKEKRLRAMGKLDPTWLEMAMGVVCLAITLLNIMFKTETKTLIFMFNPCHFVNVSSVTLLLT